MDRSEIVLIGCTVTVIVMNVDSAMTLGPLVSGSVWANTEVTARRRTLRVMQVRVVDIAVSGMLGARCPLSATSEERNKR